MNRFINFILLLNISFFYVIPSKIFVNIIGNYQKIAVVFCSLVFFIILLKNIASHKYYIFSKYIIFFSLLYISELVISYIKYNQSIIEIVLESNHFLILILYFILSLFVLNTEQKDKLQDTIILYTLILTALYLFQYIVFAFNSKIFLNIGNFSENELLRFGGLRIYESSYFIYFGAILSFSKLLKYNLTKLRKIFYFSTTILFLIELLLVTKGRMGFIIMIISFLIMVIIKNIKNYRLLFKQVIIIIMFLLIFVNIPYVENFLSSINGTDPGIAIRGEAISFYVNQLKESPILGVGFIKPTKGSDTFYFVRGMQGKYYKEDVGIIGFLNTFGIIGIIWLSLLILKITKSLIIIYKKKKHIQNIELYGLYIFMIGGLIVTSCFDVQRITMFPFYLSFIESAFINATRKI